MLVFDYKKLSALLNLGIFFCKRSIEKDRSCLTNMLVTIEACSALSSCCFNDFGSLPSVLKVKGQKLCKVKSSCKVMHEWQPEYGSGKIYITIGKHSVYVCVYAWKCVCLYIHNLYWKFKNHWTAYCNTILKTKTGL